MTYFLTSMYWKLWLRFFVTYFISLVVKKNWLALKKIYPINQDFSSSVQLNFDESYV